ncbi:MAG: BspA family leucine-rich repeat surface protein [Pseudomonadota bacterium]|nr:BspA family leucine-rich repeat surface protein [Pseudomonadota bacterium]
MRILVMALWFVATAALATGAPYVSVWEFSGDSNELVLPLPSGYEYNFTVDWGDGTQGEVTAYDDPDARHLYDEAGKYTVKITGLVQAWSFWKHSASKDHIVAVTDLGNVGWVNFFGAFTACANLTTVAGGVTDKVTDMRYMFFQAEQATPDVSKWDTAAVERMDGMFWGATAAQPDVSQWDTANLVSARRMFQDARQAQPDVSQWDTSKLEDMSYMFAYARAADPDMAKWNFAAVKQMGRMLLSVRLTTALYSAMLIRLAATSFHSSIVLHAGYSKFNALGRVARDTLVSRGWRIYDGGRDHNAN